MILGQGDPSPSARPGNDLLLGGDGRDLLDGDSGVGDPSMPDVPGAMRFDGGQDAIHGGPGDDAMTGDSRALVGEVSGDGGNDLIIGGPGADAAFGDHAGATVTGEVATTSSTSASTTASSPSATAARSRMSVDTGSDVVSGGDGAELSLIGDDTWFTPQPLGAGW